MENDLQRAYRHLLYQAMLDFRPLAWRPYGLQWISPSFYIRHIRHTRQVGELAEWLHNMAEFSRRDFAGFDEQRFWLEFSRLEKRFPALACYRSSFKNALTEARTGKWPSVEEQKERDAQIDLTTGTRLTDK